MKICSKCGQEWPIDNYSFKFKAKGIRQNHCKQCQSAYTATHYEQNKETYKARALILTVKIRKQIQERLYEYLSLHPCIDCGESNPVCLDFDHRDGGTKLFELAKATRRGYTWSKIAAEIDKCDVRCANCHRKRTAKQFGWYKLGKSGDGIE